MLLYWNVFFVVKILPNESHIFTFLMPILASLAWKSESLKYITIYQWIFCPIVQFWMEICATRPYSQPRLNVSQWSCFYITLLYETLDLDSCLTMRHICFGPWPSRDRRKEGDPDRLVKGLSHWHTFTYTHSYLSLLADVWRLGWCITGDVYHCYKGRCLHMQ